jgi:hypothetical protein
MKLITRIRAIRLTERQVLCIYLGMIALLAGLWAIVGSPVVLPTTITARACPSATWVKPSHLRGECRTGGTRRSYSHPQTNRAGPPELLERVEVLSEHVALLLRLPWEFTDYAPTPDRRMSARDRRSIAPTLNIDRLTEKYFRVTDT